MKISTFWYCMKEGMKNICRNIWFSLASVATISACIFLFCLFFSIIANIRYMVKHVESTVGITVLFDENLTEQDIQGLGEIIHQRPEIREMYYISAEDAWNSFKEEYFAGHEELAEGFAEDNPLAGSASYEIFLNDISQQDELVAYLQGLDGVRQVNYSNCDRCAVFPDHRCASGSIPVFDQQHHFRSSGIPQTGVPDHASDRCYKFYDPCTVYR